MLPMSAQKRSEESLRRRPRTGLNILWSRTEVVGSHFGLFFVLVRAYIFDENKKSAYKKSAYIFDELEITYIGWLVGVCV